MFLNNPFEGPGAINRIIAFFGEKRFSVIGQHQLNMFVGETGTEPINLNFNDL